MGADTTTSHKAVEQLVAHYQAKARAVGRLGVAIGASAGVLVGSVPLSPLRFAWPIPSGYGFATILGGLLVGVVIGYVIGDARAQMYHRMAEQARLQLLLEQRISDNDTRMTQLLTALTARAAAAARTQAPQPVQGAQPVQAPQPVQVPQPVPVPQPVQVAQPPQLVEAPVPVEQLAPPTVEVQLPAVSQPPPAPPAPTPLPVPLPAEPLSPAAVVPQQPQQPEQPVQTVQQPAQPYLTEVPPIAPDPVAAPNGQALMPPLSPPVSG